MKTVTHHILSAPGTGCTNATYIIVVLEDSIAPKCYR